MEREENHVVCIGSLGQGLPVDRVGEVPAEIHRDSGLTLVSGQERGIGLDGSLVVDTQFVTL